MYFKCKKCGKLVDDGSAVDKICAMCILYLDDAGMFGSATEKKCTKKPQEVNPAACQLQEA